MSKKKILFYTGSRADYSLLKTLIDILKFKQDLILVVGPHHFSKKFGNSYKEIEKKNIYKIVKSKIKINYSNVDIPKFISQSVYKYKKILEKYKPSMIVLLGDRYETLSFAIASFFSNIKICHFHGGELTKGSFDDTIRHMITKLSNYHFVCSEKYRKRVIKMGENKKNVFNFGSIGAEKVIKSANLLKKKLFNKFKLDLNKKTILITFHPETISKLNYENQIKYFLNSFSKLNNLNLVFTSANSDPGGYYFNKKIKVFIKDKNNSYFFPNLGGALYSSFLKHSDLIIGNSSSAIIEAPSFNNYILNVGKRQDGRQKNNLIYDCDLNTQKINKKINFLLNKKRKKIKNPFYKKHSIKLSSKKLSNIAKIVQSNLKFFYD